MQVVVKPSFYQSFGGINFMDADFRSLGLAAPINEQLGQRSANAQYSYAAIIKSLAFMFYIGGEVLDDLNIVREQIKDHPFLQICSPDTVEYVCKELQQPTQLITTDKGISHQLNAHEGFNRLLPQLCIHAGV